MTLPEGAADPKPLKPLSKSLDAIATLREALQKRLAESKLSAVETTASPQPAPSSATTAEKQVPVTLDPAEWPRIMYRIADRSQRLAQEFLARQKDKPFDFSAFDPAHLSEAFLELTDRILKDPERLADAQMALWQGYFQIWQTALARMQGQNAMPVVASPPTDKRFKDKEWQNVWLFDFIKQTYLLTAQFVHGVVRQETEKLDPKLAQKLNFYTRQMVDAASPSNFWMTNPEVLRTTMETGGENLIKGFENLLDDLERGHGQLRIRMTDAKAFHVGENLATTKGQVIYQNNLMQLIQYEPLTPNVHQTPLLIVPPWINKFYILDLKEKNSLIHYLVAQGHTVFCVSWINPGARHALVNFEDYMEDGVLTALREVRKATGVESVNTVGYCIGGTLLATSLAYLAALDTPRPDLPRVASATYLVTLVDFSDPGDIGVFIDEEQIQLVEAQMAKIGYFDAATMATTFTLLRANDLIWSFVVNNYLLGREPFPFDILYWNSDSTNLPAVMQSYYLRNMYLKNKLIEPNALQMKGVPIDLRRVAVPSFLLATSEDHIAPWQSTYKGTQIYAGPVRFVLAGSGHIAGVINPPNANKYGYWTNDTNPAEGGAWLKGAAQHTGSWWPEWIHWLAPHAGEEVPARAVLNGIEPAPGSYVKALAV